jgi:hypothetical protein
LKKFIGPTLPPFAVRPELGEGSRFFQLPNDGDRLFDEFSPTG